MSYIVMVQVWTPAGQRVTEWSGKEHSHQEDAYFEMQEIDDPDVIDAWIRTKEET